MATVGGGWNFSNNAYHLRMQRWRIAVERQLASHDVLEATYEGTYSSNMTYNVPSAKGIPSTYYNFTQTRNDTINNALNMRCGCLKTPRFQTIFPSYYETNWNGNNGYLNLTLTPQCGS